MASRDDEQDRWRELAGQLRHDWRLAAVPTQAETVIRWRRDPAAARSGTVIPATVWMPPTAGACLGHLAVASGVIGSDRISVTGITILITLLVLSGAALPAIGVAACRHANGTGGRR
jgi:hypothetical protein